MRKEELLAGQLLSLFSTYKRRQCAGTVQFYSDRLLGLEDALVEDSSSLDPPSLMRWVRLSSSVDAAMTGFVWGLGDISLW